MMFYKYFNNFLVLAVAAVGVSAQITITLDECTIGCLNYAAPYCGGKYGIPIDVFFTPVSDPRTIHQ